MTDSTQAPAYKQPWVIDNQAELEILKAKAEGHGLKVEIVANPGDFFEIGSADCQIGDGQFGVWVLGDTPLSAKDGINFFHEVDDAWQEHRQTGGTKEAPVIQS